MSAHGLWYRCCFLQCAMAIVTPLLLHCHCDGIAFVAVVATAVLLVVGTTLVITIAIVVSLLL